MDKWLDIAERAEAATGPSRKLDLAIMSLLVREGVLDRSHPAYPSYAFTASLDAAMTLVPEGCVWGVGNSDDPSPHIFRATVMPPRGMHTAYTTTPALALVAASARAHAVKENTND